EREKIRVMARTFSRPRGRISSRLTEPPSRPIVIFAVMRELLTVLLDASAPPEATAWLQERLAEQETRFSKRPFYYAFSGVSRHFPKRGRVLVSAEQASQLRERVPGLRV